MVKQLKVSAAIASAAIKKSPPAKADKTAGCNWCAKGQCWTHNQIAKPAGAKAAAAGAGAGKKAGKQGAMDTQAMMKMMKSGGSTDDMMQAVMSMMGMGGSSGNVGSSGPELHSKMALCQAHGQALGRMLKKGEEIDYENVEVGEGDERYQSTVTVSGQAFAGECAKSHKHAEDNAAKMALKSMYPAAANKSNGTKRKGAPGAMQTRQAQQAPNVRMQLNNACMILKGGPLTKEDVIVTCDESPNAGFKATLVLALMNNQRFTGTGASKKDAENVAAQAALNNGQFKAKVKAAEAKKAAAKKTK